MSRIDELQKLHEDDPKDADVMYMLAQEHAKEGDPDEAVAWYDKCLAVDPAYLYAYFHKARALESAGEIEDAKDALREGVKSAQVQRDEKALGEIGAYLELLEHGEV